MPVYVCGERLSSLSLRDAAYAFMMRMFVLRRFAIRSAETKDAKSCSPSRVLIKEREYAERASVCGAKRRRVRVTSALSCERSCYADAFRCARVMSLIYARARCLTAKHSKPTPTRVCPLRPTFEERLARVPNAMRNHDARRHRANDVDVMSARGAFYARRAAKSVEPFIYAAALGREA